ncbi:MAG: phosphoribosyltransferase family protein [Rhizomicrobium sp.]
MKASPIPLFSEGDIAARVSALAGLIAAATPKPDIAAPILVGGFMFAADLLRALSQHGLDLAVDILWLRSYGSKRESGGDVSMILGPSENARGKNVLVIDGVLDHGRTLMKARALFLAAGAASVTSVVAVDKSRKDAVLRADYTAFAGVSGFIVGYGMDDAGAGRGLPYIGVMP